MSESARGCPPGPAMPCSGWCQAATLGHPSPPFTPRLGRRPGAAVTTGAGRLPTQVLCFPNPHPASCAASSGRGGGASACTRGPTARDAKQSAGGWWPDPVKVKAPRHLRARLSSSIHRSCRDGESPGRTPELPGEPSAASARSAQSSEPASAGRAHTSVCRSAPRDSQVHPGCGHRIRRACISW